MLEPAGGTMAVVRGWTELSPSERLGPFMHSVLFPLLALPKRGWVSPNTSAIQALGEERAAIGITDLYQTNLFLNDNPQLPFRLLPDGHLHRGILLESEARV